MFGAPCCACRSVVPDVPSHLHYIMLELIKNSMRATVDFHGLDEMDNNPIRVVIADGEGNEVSKGVQGGGASVGPVRNISIVFSPPSPTPPTPPPFPTRLRHTVTDFFTLLSFSMSRALTFLFAPLLSNRTS